MQNSIHGALLLGGWQLPNCPQAELTAGKQGTGIQIETSPTDPPNELKRGLRAQGSAGSGHRLAGGAALGRGSPRRSRPCGASAAIPAGSMVVFLTPGDQVNDYDF